jgi:hypothetical protein
MMNISSSPTTHHDAKYDESEAKEDQRSLVLFLLGSVGYEVEADRVARISRRILESEQIVEGISRYQFLPKMRTRLMHAAWKGNLQRLNFIAGLGARVNMIATGTYGWSGCTALHFASWNGHTDCVRSLCDRGAAVNAQTGFGWSPLHVACTYCHLDAARLLLERGAQIDLRNISGFTALHTASCNAMVSVARLLCESGANTLLSASGRTPYAWACFHHGVDSPTALLLKAYPH